MITWRVRADNRAIPPHNRTCPTNPRKSGTRRSLVLYPSLALARFADPRELGQLGDVLTSREEITAWAKAALAEEIRHRTSWHFETAHHASFISALMFKQPNNAVTRSNRRPARVRPVGRHPRSTPARRAAAATRG